MTDHLVRSALARTAVWFLCIIWTILTQERKKLKSNVDRLFAIVIATKI